MRRASRPRGGYARLLVRLRVRLHLLLRVRLLVLVLVRGLTSVCPARAQQPPAPAATEAQLRVGQAELERIRRQRDSLERAMVTLQGSAHSLGEEMANVAQQADATARAVRALDAQLGALAVEVSRTTGRLVRAADELAVKRAVLHRRLIDIYKRGPLYTTQALLTAGSFGELITRYKYLVQLARRDRDLVRRVEALAIEVGQQRQTLVALGAQFARSREERAAEERRLRLIEKQRERSLAVVRRATRETEAVLEQLRRDASRITSAIAASEDGHRRAEAAPAAPAPTSSTIRSVDFGHLDWPIDGAVIYRFGRQVKPNNTTTRWNGVGIAAPEGSPVRTIAAGTVAVVEPFGAYGLTVIVDHGGGDYSVYGSLASAAVARGERVAGGQVIGAVGTSDPEIPAHLHFEMRPKGRAMDPLAWLRRSIVAPDR